MTNIDKELESVHSRSAKLYLYRQQLQLQLQQIQLNIQQTEAELLSLDGEEKVLTRMREQEKENG